MTHEEIRNSLPAFALGALDPEERVEVATHLRTCAACTAELATFDRVVESVGLDAPPVTPPGDLLTRVLARIAAAPPRPAPAVAPERSTPPASPRPLWTSGLALAASLTLAVGASLYAFTLRAELSSLRDSVATSSAQASKLRDELATLRRDWVTLRRVMDVMKAPDMLRVDLKGQDKAPAATGRAFWSQTAGLVFTADRMPALPAGRVYQLWTITGTTARSAGLFVPDSAGGASVTAVVPARAAPPDAFGVTIEPAGGSSSPTLPIVLIGSAGTR